MSSIASNPASVEHTSGGLDRSSFNIYDKADRHIVVPLQKQASHSDSSDIDSDEIDQASGEPNTSPKKFANVRRVSAKVRSTVKKKTHKILHASREQHAPQVPAAPTVAPAATHDGDDDRLLHPLPEDKGPQLKDLLHNPVDTVSSVLHGASGAKMADVVDNQVIAHGANVNLIRAYDKVADADNKEEQHSALGELEDLKKERQDQYVRWTMDRHVLKVRRIPPLDLQRPQKNDFRIGHEKEQGQVNWAMYGQHVRTLLHHQSTQSWLWSQTKWPKGSNAEVRSSLHAFTPGTTVTNTSTTLQSCLRQMRTVSTPVWKGFS